MKIISYLFCAIIMYSCGNGTAKHKYQIIFEFEDLTHLSANDKQGTVATLNQRLEKFASNYEVKLNNKQQIEIVLRTDYELDKVNALVTNPGKLEFWECVKSKQLSSFFMSAFDLYDTESDSINSISNPFDSSSAPIGGGVLSVDMNSVEELKEVFQRKEILALLSQPTKNVKFLFGQPSDGRVDVYVVKLPPSGKAFVNETHIVDAAQSFNQNNRPSVFMKMNSKGAQRWERMTNTAYQQQSQIAITLNDVVYSAPIVSSGPIIGGKTEISGNFTVEEAQDFAIIFSSHNRIPKLKFVNSSAIND